MVRTGICSIIYNTHTLYIRILTRQDTSNPRLSDTHDSQPKGGLFGSKLPELKLWGINKFWGLE